MKALIFDMDGTILNTIEDIAGAVNYILYKYNFRLRKIDEVRFFVGNGLRKTLERSLPEDISSDFVDGIYEEFSAFYRSHSNIHTGPYDGIVDALRILKEAGYKLAVVSNKREEAVNDLCNIFFDGLFDVCVGDSEDRKKKPDPEMVEYALSKLDEPKTEAIYIGDSEVDIMTAANSGLDGVFVSWGFRGREFLEKNGASNIVDTPEDLLKFIMK